MAIGTDYEIQNDKDVRYIGAAHGVTGAGYYTVLEFHQWLQGLADDASASGDDYLDITRDTPTDKSYDTIITLINGYNIDDTAAEHLYNGSIIQGGASTTIYDGLQIIAAEGCHVEIVQNGAIITNDFWNSTPFGLSSEGLNRDVANGISARFMVKVRSAGADIDGRRLICQTREWGKTYSEFKVNGTSRGVNVAALTYASDLNNTTVVGTVATWTTIANLSAGYNGIDVNNDAADEYYWSEWNRATYSINQFYERMKWVTRRGSAETLYGLNGELLRGITHEITVDNPSVTDFSAVEAVSWSGGTGQMLAINDVSAATKMWIQLLTGVAPTNDQTITGITSTASCQVNVTVTERTLSFPFCGVSTGTSIIGSYGFGIEAVDLSASDKVFDLTDTLRQAPNYVTFTVGGPLVSGEDYVLVGPRGYRFEYDGETSGPFTEGETLTFGTPAGTAKLAELRDMGTYGEMVTGPILSGSVPTDNSTISGGTSGAAAAVNGAVSNSIDKRQLTLNGALSGGSVTSVVVNEAIPGDTPSIGTIRIRRASGRYSRHPYSAWVAGTKTFTITSANFSTDNAPSGGNVYISYVDVLADDVSEAFTGVYVADRALFIRVRDGGGSPIKTFESTGTLTSGGGSATAVRTSDA
jgi:hypothetical protein